MKAPIRSFSLFPIIFFSSYLIFSLIILITILISLRRTSIFLIWVILEVNIIRVLPLLAAKGGIFEGDASLKYFISQRVASILFIFFIGVAGQEIIFLEVFFLVILFKLGLAPFHGWMVRIFIRRNYSNIFIMGTVQKIIPLHLLSLFYFEGGFLWAILFINLILVRALMWSQTRLRLILLLSSVVNSIWILTAVNISNDWLTYILIYATMNFRLIYFLSYFNISSFTQLANLRATLKVRVSLIFARLAGLPPFLGFIQKLVILKALFFTTQFLMIFILILFSLAILWVYLRAVLRLYALSENKVGGRRGGLIVLLGLLIVTLLPGGMLL